jgi:PAS domain S-box-containing protein
MVGDLAVGLYNQLPVAVYTCNEEGIIISCNESATALWGRRPNLGNEKWSGALRTFDNKGSLVTTEEHPAVRVVHEKKLITNTELIIEQPDGNKRDVLVSSAPTFDESGNFTGSINILLDITEQKKNDARQAMMVSIIESSDDAIISKTLEGIITSWNQGAEALFGYTEAEALGRHISLIIPPEKLDEERFIIKKISGGEKIEHFETFRLRKDGTPIPISLTISPIRNSKGAIIGVAKIARDITRQKAADDQLRHYASQLEAEVEARTKMLSETIVTLQETQENLNDALENEKQLGQLKSRFVSMASHEFRTPLSAIKLSGSLIEKYAETSDLNNIYKHAHKIKNSVSNLTNILNDFLSLEKLETGKVKPDLAEFDVIKFCEEVRDEMQMVARPGQDIIYQHTGTIGSVTLDQNLLHNCIINLLSNAIKYSNEDTIIELNSEVTACQYLITVSDHGIGIPDDEQKHLFEAFFRANNTGTIQGTGLGLNIVSRYTSLMNGEISFESVFGKGSRFTLRFPKTS